MDVPTIRIFERRESWLVLVGLAVLVWASNAGSPGPGAQAMAPEGGESAYRLGRMVAPVILGVLGAGVYDALAGWLAG